MRNNLLVGVSILTLCASFGATAATAADAETAVDEVVVTASRIQQTGFTAPTPTTVLSADDVARVAPVQISEALALIPAFRTSSASSNPAQTANLRAIGATRTLVLVDGRRHVPTQSDGTMDLNLIPAALVERTEVVTGGASASWGSDAVAGVVNLILRTKLEGLRGSAQYGVSKYGDAENYTGSLAGGTSFLGGKGHVVFGMEYAQDKGIRDLATPTFSRPWAAEERGTVSNAAFATNGLPGVLYVRGARRADNSAGGLITNGPLAGTAFGANATPFQFGYGTRYSNNMVGGADNFGEAVVPGGDLRYPFKRYSALVHAEYEASDALTVFTELSYAHSLGHGFTNPLRFQGAVTGASTCTTSTVGAVSTGALLININNPYIPAATRAAMQAANVTCIGMGKVLRELPELRFNDGSPYVWRGVVGAKGDLGAGWSWDAYYQYGENRSQQRREGNINMTKFRFSLDAITGPGGTPICRPLSATATAAQQADFQGCVPVNMFGLNSISQAAVAYFGGTSSLVNHTKEQVAAANLRGDLYHTWAGPIAVATGVEWRKEELNAIADPVAEATLWQSGSRKGSAGEFNVKEVYGEVGVPLAKDQPWADSLSLNGAVRYTDYSSSGSVVTWKVGGGWDLGDFRLRATRSRDIRAGNLAELFTAVSTALQTLRNPVTGASAATTVETRGNRTLDPEKADTVTAGIVYSPGFAPGLRMSVDYYKIKIAGVIGTLTAQQTIDRCLLENSAEACALVTRDANGLITKVGTVQLNLNKFETSGVDIEAAYTMPVDRLFSGAEGSLTARVLATYIDKLATTAAIGARVTDPAGQFNNPHWTVFGNLNYQTERLSLGAEVRHFAGGTIDNTLTPGAISATGINIGHIGGTTYLHLTGSYALDKEGKYEVFGRINNVFNTWPPFPSIGGTAGNNSGGFFDEVGRAYRIGFRFKY